MSHKTSRLLQHLSAPPAIRLISISAAFIYSSLHHSFSSPCLLFLLGYEWGFFGRGGGLWLLQHMWVDHKSIFTSHTPTHAKVPAWCRTGHNNGEYGRPVNQDGLPEETQVAGEVSSPWQLLPPTKETLGGQCLLTARWGSYLWMLLGDLPVRDTICKMSSCCLRKSACLKVKNKPKLRHKESSHAHVCWKQEKMFLWVYRLDNSNMKVLTTRWVDYL